jgi:hypothetical protein
MIHTLRGPAPIPRRRIAIIEAPRLGRARLGLISDAGLPNSMVAGWTTISDQTPSNAETWLASVLYAQGQTRETKPGTLNYSPAPNPIPAPVIAPWNSWGLNACNSDGTPVTAQPAPAAGAPSGGIPNWLLIGAGLITAAAAARYLIQGK